MASFFFRNRKKPVIPEFETLKVYEGKDMYFVRKATWDWLDKNRIVVHDPFNPRLITMDPWPQIVFIGANGQNTVSEYVHILAGDYEKEIPPNLDKAIIDEIISLTELGIIELLESKRRPEPEFERAKSGQMPWSTRQRNQP